MSDSPPPPPPPPPSMPTYSVNTHPPNAPIVATTAPIAGGFLVELIIYNGNPFKDHWAYFLVSHADPDTGVKMHVTGDVKNGFNFEIKRSLNFEDLDRPWKRIPLQWIDGKFIDEKAVFNDGVFKIDDVPVCAFEASAYKVKPPNKSLNAVDSQTRSSQRIVQRNCQTWIVESAEQLANDGIFTNEVAQYLRNMES